MPDEVGVGADLFRAAARVLVAVAAGKPDHSDTNSSVGLHLDLVVLGHRVGQQPVAHQPCPRLASSRDLASTSISMARPDMHRAGLGEAQGVQRVLHRLALRIEQAGAGHDADVDPVRHSSPCGAPGARGSGR